LVRIRSVRTSSPASRAGLRPSDRLISCQGDPVDDWIDFAYRASGTSITVETSRGGRTRNALLRRAPGNDWGLTFQGQEPATCRRNCVFCFVAQNPPGVRESLLVKDDDIRYSFYQGTFVTLSEPDVRLAVDKHLSPVHVSVHSTDPHLRGRLLGTGRPEPVLPYLFQLSSAGITIEAQVVLVPGWNDGVHLERTLRDLMTVPSVSSTGVVPVGLTAHREGLTRLSRPTREQAAAATDICTDMRAIAMTGRGTPFVYPSDELLVMAGTDIPDQDYYEGCGMKADGIGMLAELLALEGRRSFSGAGTVCTGTLAAPFIRRVLQGSDYRVLETINGFFGPDVGVSGLLSGEDIVRSASGSDTGPGGGSLLLPAVMFNQDRLTVDGMTPEMISAAAGRPVEVFGRMEELP